MSGCSPSGSPLIGVGSSITRHRVPRQDIAAGRSFSSSISTVSVACTLIPTPNVRNFVRVKLRFRDPATQVSELLLVRGRRSCHDQIMPTIQIRPLRGSDLDLLAELEGEFPLRSSSPWRPDDEEDFDFFARSLPKVGGMGVVATVDGESVGYGLMASRISKVAGVDHASDARLVSHIAVLPEFRNQGIGSKLLNAFGARGRKAGFAFLYAHIPSHLKSFYERHRWTVAGSGEAIAWIEAPSERIWEEAAKQGMVDEPKRKVSMLRTEGIDDDPDFPHLAHIVLAPKKVPFFFVVPHTGDDALRAAYSRLVAMCVEDSTLYAKLPDDIYFLLDPLLIELVGLEWLNKLKVA